MQNHFYIPLCDRVEYEAVLENGGEQTCCMNSTTAQAIKDIAGMFGFISVQIDRTTLKEMVAAGLAKTTGGGFEELWWRLDISPAGMKKLHAEGRLVDNRRKKRP